MTQDSNSTSNWFGIANADELQKNGWYFIKNEPSSTPGIPGETNKLDLRYLFGKTNSVDSQQLLLSIVPIVEDVTPINVQLKKKLCLKMVVGVL